MHHVNHLGESLDNHGCGLVLNARRGGFGEECLHIRRCRLVRLVPERIGISDSARTGVRKVADGVHPDVKHFPWVRVYGNRLIENRVAPCKKKVDVFRRQM